MFIGPLEDDLSGGEEHSDDTQKKVRKNPELKITLVDYNNDDDLGLEGQEDEEDRTGT